RVLRELPRFERSHRAAQPRAHGGAHRALRARAPREPRAALQPRLPADACEGAGYGPHSMRTAPVLTHDELRAIETRAARDPGPALRGGAGRAAAGSGRRLARDTGGAILVVAGPGNNGGDAWVAAAHLLESFHRVVVYDVAGGKPRAVEAQAAQTAFRSRQGE